MLYLLNNLLSIPLALAQKSGVDEVANETTNQITSLVGSIIAQIPLWITAILVVIVSFVIARIVKSSVENKMTAEGLEEEHKEIQIVAGRTANAAVLIIGITVALKIAGIDLTPIIAAGAFGMGFALQDLIMNFVAGVMILSARHVTIGDVIRVNGTTGKIVEIQTRATVLKAFDGTKIVVPNADLFKNQVTNFTANPFRRIQLVNGVAYGSDLKKVMEIVLKAVKETPGVIPVPKPSVLLYEWGDYSINFKINAWVERKGGWIKVRNKLIINIGKALDDAGIEVPYPIQTVYLSKQAEQKQGQENGQTIGAHQGDAQFLHEEKVEKMVMESLGNKVKVASDAPMPAVQNKPQIPGTPSMQAPQTEAKPIEVAIPVPHIVAKPVQQTDPAQPIQETPEWLKKATHAIQPAPVLIGPTPIGTLAVPPGQIEPQSILLPEPLVANTLQPLTTPIASAVNENADK